MQIDNKSKVAPRVIAEVCMEKRQWAQAIEALEKYKVRAPLDEFSYGQLATCYLNIGQQEKALPNLIELHEHTMTTPMHARRIADIYRSLGQDDLALKYYGDVIQINPYETAAYQAMASIHLRARRYSQAVTSAKSIVLLAPQVADSWFTLAKVEFFAGRSSHDIGMLKSARADAEKAIKIESSEQASELIRKIDELLKQGNL
jgi:tetratricopeptide (TPR) repeat protein